MKEVLVLYNLYSRVVKTNDLSSLKGDIWSTFSDVLPPEAESSILLKIKDDSWGGMFINLKENESLPDKCVIQVHVIKKVSFDTLQIMYTVCCSHVE